MKKIEEKLADLIAQACTEIIFKDNNTIYAASPEQIARRLLKAPFINEAISSLSESEAMQIVAKRMAINIAQEVKTLPANAIIKDCTLAINYILE